MIWRAEMISGEIKVTGNMLTSFFHFYEGFIYKPRTLSRPINLYRLSSLEDASLINWTLFYICTSVCLSVSSSLLHGPYFTNSVFPRLSNQSIFPFFTKAFRLSTQLPHFSDFSIVSRFWFLSANPRFSKRQMLFSSYSFTRQSFAKVRLS